jgi:hypothetical protein
MLYPTRPGLDLAYQLLHIRVTPGPTGFQRSHRRHRTCQKPPVPTVAGRVDLAENRLVLDFWWQ